MSKVTLIGLDLAKNIFRVHGIDAKGKRLFNKNLHRESLVPFLRNLPPCAVAMEACCSAHYWARTIQELGHTTKIIHAKYVTPYRLGDKNDANDAAAICAAAQRPDMPSVRVKTRQQVDMQGLHRVRDSLVKEKTATINQIRGFLAENGIVIKQGPSNVPLMLPFILEDEENGLSGMARRLLRLDQERLAHLKKQMEEIAVMLKEFAAREERCQRLMQVPGIGITTATLLASEVGNGSGFANGRAFAAYLGLVPRQYSSGGKSKLRGIGKKGNRQMRTLLVHCARAAMRTYNQGKNPFGGGAIDIWLGKIQQRRGRNKSIVALAGKLARIAWSILAREASFQANSVYAVAV